MKSEFLSSRELRIFKHQIELDSIGLQGQEKIRNSKVLIIGAGGKGACAIQILAASGVGNLGICDHRVVEETSLPRQCLYGQGDLGKQKAIISKQKILENNQMIQINIHNIRLNENNIAPIISGYDIIADVTDNGIAHLLIDKAALNLNKPVVFCDLSQSLIIVSVFHYKNNHSFSQLRDDQIASGAPVIPAESVQYSLAGSLVANEVLKIILESQEILDGKVLKFDVTSYQMTVANL
jgi:sulfur-carrier protein adenylyltransferase/sulfurtransferase